MFHKRLLRCKYISLASNSSRDCTELVTVEFSFVFKMCRYRVNASSSFATVTFFIVFKMCRHSVNASSNFATVTFFIVFKMCRHRVKASSSFATVTFFIVFKMCRYSVNADCVHTMPAHFENGEKCDGCKI